MSGVVLDTSFLADVFRGYRPAIDVMEDLEQGSDVLLIPSIVVYELWEGVERSRTPVREMQVVEEALDAHEVIPFRREHAARAGAVSGNLARRGIKVPDADMMIAGIALAEDATVLTRNARDFERIPDLRVRTY